MNQKAAEQFRFIQKPKFASWNTPIFFLAKTWWRLKKCFLFWWRFFVCFLWILFAANQLRCVRAPVSCALPDLWTINNLISWTRQFSMKCPGKTMRLEVKPTSQPTKSCGLERNQQSGKHFGNAVHLHGNTSFQVWPKQNKCLGIIWGTKTGQCLMDAGSCFFVWDIQRWEISWVPPKDTWYWGRGGFPTMAP